MRSVRLREGTHRTLMVLAEQTGESIPDLLDKAVELYRRQQFLDGLADDFEALRRDSEAWREELEERQIWDAALNDGSRSP